MLPTRDHDIIRQWAQRHDAFPAQIRQLKFDGEPAILTFTFGEPDEQARPDIQPISWENFFALFDLLQLSLAFDESTPTFDIVRVTKRPQQLHH